MDTNNIAVFIYFGIGAFAFFFVVLSFLIGEVGDFFHDIASPATDWMGDHLPFGGDHAVEFPRILNTGSMLGFIGGFGFGAALAMSTMNVNAIAGAGFGILGGIALGTSLGFIYLGLRSAHATSSYTESELKGMIGQVTEKVYAGSVGQVSCVVHDVRVWRTARSVDDKEIAIGTPVRVERVVGNILYVVSENQPESYQTNTAA